MLEIWEVSCLTSDGKLNEKSKLSPGYKELEDALVGKTTIGFKVLKIFRSQLQRNIVECLLSTGLCSSSDISGYTGVDTDVINLYRKSVYKIDTAFDSMIDFLDYIESGIEYYGATASGDSEKMLNAFLLKRWASTLGVDFVLWKFKIIQIEYNTADLYNNIMKESFFYHKEKSMGNEEVSLSDYLKSTNMLLSSVRTKDNIKANNDEEAVLDIEERLDIIIIDEAPPAIGYSAITDEDFINNAVLSDK